MTIFTAPPTGPGPTDPGPATDPDGPGPTDAAPARTRSRWSAFWRHPATRRLTALALVVLIIALTITAFSSLAGGTGPNDPRSSRPDGAGAGAAVLRQEGVDIRPTRRVDDAVRDGAGATVLVAFPDRLTANQARRLLQIPDARIILLAPDSALQVFGAQAESAARDREPLIPQCADPTAIRAGAIRFSSGYQYRPTAAALTDCYLGANGYSYLRVGAADGREVELLGGGWTNREIADEGNAALITGLFGSRDRLVWLLETAPDDESTGGGGGAEPGLPTVLPGWWPMAVAQAVIAVIVVGVWRGRRLGPIILERLPVRVRASETVEGHGRLYFRLNAWDRAAAALRDGVVRRLSRRYGHGNDPLALAAALAERTGRDSRQVHQVLFGPEPTDDDQLLDLAENLDQLEQEARQP